MFDCPDAKAQASVGLRMTHGPPLDNHQAAARPGKFIKTSLNNMKTIENKSKSSINMLKITQHD